MTKTGDKCILKSNKVLCMTLAFEHKRKSTFVKFTKFTTSLLNYEYTCIDIIIFLIFESLSALLKMETWLNVSCEGLVLTINLKSRNGLADMVLYFQMTVDLGTLDINRLSKKELLLAHLILSFITMGYVWQDGDTGAAKVMYHYFLAESQLNISHNRMYV